MRSTRGYLFFAPVYSRKIRFSFTPKFFLIFCRSYHGNFSNLFHSYIFSKLIIFNKKSTAYKQKLAKKKTQKHKNKTKQKKINRQTKTTKCVYPNAGFQTKPITKKTQTLELRLVYNNNNQDSSQNYRLGAEEVPRGRRPQASQREINLRCSAILCILRQFREMLWLYFIIVVTMFLVIQCAQTRNTYFICTDLVASE